LYLFSDGAVSKRRIIVSPETRNLDLDPAERPSILNLEPLNLEPH